MILPQTYLQSLILLIISFLFLGSWPLLFRRSKGWRFELFGLDFGIGAFLAAFVFALTFGNLGFDGFSFVDDVMHAGKFQWVVGFAAGALFNLGNMLWLGAVSVAGFSVAATIGLGLSLILGVGVPQLLRHSMSPLILFGSFVLIFAAIIWAALVHHAEVSARAEALVRQAKEAKRKILSLPSTPKGLILALAAGLLFSLFYPLATRSRESEIGLGPYSCMFLVALGIFLSAPVLFIFFINLPVEGEPLEPTAYFRVSLKAHFTGFLAGGMWSTGALIPMLLTSVEPAAQIPQQITFPMTFAAPLLTAVLGILVLREGRTPTGRLRPTAVIMLLLLAAGVGLAAIAPLVLKRAA